MIGVRTYEVIAEIPAPHAVADDDIAVLFAAPFPGVLLDLTLTSTPAAQTVRAAVLAAWEIPTGCEAIETQLRTLPVPITTAKAVYDEPGIGDGLSVTLIGPDEPHPDTSDGVL